MSQSTLSDQIRPRPLIACLNCATHWVQGMFSHLCEVLYVYKYTYIYSHRILSLVILAYYHNNCLSYKIQISYDWLISKIQRTWPLLVSYYDVFYDIAVFESSYTLRRYRPISHFLTCGCTIGKFDESCHFLMQPIQYTTEEFLGIFLFPKLKHEESVKSIATDKLINRQTHI